MKNDYTGRRLWGGVQPKASVTTFMGIVVRIPAEVLGKIM